MIPFFLVSLLPYAAVLVSAASTPFNNNLAVRQIQTDPACANDCADFTDTSSEQCNNTVVKDIATCFTCNIQHGSFTQDQAQQTLNTFVQACDDNGQPVNNVTISVTSGSVPSGGGGSTPPTHTSEPAEEPTTTEAKDPSDDPSQTDTAGDSASASANATDSASASGPSAGASSAERMKCGRATLMTAVMVALSIVVGSA
ncbi:hypothetical protein B0H14DRAFT_3909473 [Mycena olivaceomarginata]|nr:hypothetical protein B0H14DRAFT_3909473 [Mycena olivaceomarginata]